MDIGGKDCHPNRSLSRAEEKEMIDRFFRSRTNMTEGRRKRRKEKGRETGGIKGKARKAKPQRIPQAGRERADD